MDSTPDYMKQIANIVDDYLHERTSFDETERRLADLSKTDLQNSKLLKDIYHVLQHFEIDQLDNTKLFSCLNEIVNALSSGVCANVEKAINYFYKN